MDFDTLMKKYPWKPIPGCPGRYLLKTPELLPLEKLVGKGVIVAEYRVPQAPDPVLVARFERGGLISYRKRDGGYIHTLNTPEGQLRKLKQLGIE